MTRLAHIFLATIALLLLSACSTSSGFRSSVSEFGQLTGAAAAAQNESLNVIIDDEQERVAAALAKERVDLVLARPDCLPPVAGGTPPCTSAMLA